MTVEPSPLAGPAPVATREHALRDMALQIGARLANLALGVVVTALVVRTLGATRYGEWLTILTVFQLLGYFTSFGLEAVTVREAAADRRAAPDWVSALIVTRLLLSLPVLVLGVGVLLAVRESQAMLVAGLILLIEVPLSVGTSLQVVHQLRVANAMPMVVLTVNSVVWGAAVVAISVAGGGLVPFAVAMTATTGLAAGLQAVTALRVMHLRPPSRQAIHRLLRTGAPLGVAGLLVVAYARIDQVIVFEQVGARGAGQYGAAYRLLEQAHFIPMSVMTTLSPLIARLWTVDRDRVMSVVTQAAELLTIASLGGLAFVLVAATPIMRFFFGEGLVPGAEALPVLCASFVVVCFGYLCNNLMLVMGLVRRQVVVALVGLVVNVAGNVVLVPRYGFMAAAWMTLATEVAVVGVGLWYVRRGLGDRRPGLGRLPQVVAAAAGLLAALELASSAGARLAVLAPMALVVYSLLLLAVGAVSPVELRALVLRRAA